MSTSRGKVGVWWMPVGSPSAQTIARWHAPLDAGERARAGRFRMEEDRLTYAAAHWLLRIALAAMGGRPPEAWRFVTAAHGKPLIDPAAGLPMLPFNLSHTRGFVACAVGGEADIGIDVERLDRDSMNLDIAGRFFSPAEIASLRAASPEEQAVTFFRLWTLKEAFLKATGEGLGRPLDSFSFALDPVTIDFAAGSASPDADGESDEARRWQFVEFRPTAEHLVALVIRQPRDIPVPLSVHPMDPSGEREARP